jgi:hypothetical protein
MLSPLTWSKAPTVAALAILFPAFSPAATPSSGTVNPKAGSSTTWTGVPVAATNGESTCVDGTNCDVYILNVSGTTSSYSNLYVNVILNWGLLADEYDIYVHKGDLTGPVVKSATFGPGSTQQQLSFSPASLGTGTYTIHIVASDVSPTDSYTGTVTVAQTPVNPPQATFKAPTYQNLKPPAGMGENSGEPSIGVNWNTGSIMNIAVLDTLQLTMNTSTSPATPNWTLRNNPISNTTTLDPILFTDHSTGRTFVSQLAGTTSLMTWTDNDGVTWNPSQGGGIASGVDHQTVGGGPFKSCTSLQAQLNPTQCALLAARGPITGNPLGTYPDAVYYASQDIGLAQMALSRDGGTTFEVAHAMYTLEQCGGLHGHVKVGPDGTVFVPNKNCSGYQGLVVSQDNGLSFTVQAVPGSTPGASDPSVGIGAKGRVYFGYTDGNGHPKIAVSDDNGQSWNYNQDVGVPFGIQNTAFPEVVAGDNDRAAFFFLGTPSAGPGTADDSSTVFNGVWHGYIATTIDGGKNWKTVDVTPNDPVQLGVICTYGTTCPSGTRNLLDFNDISLDKYGRVYAVYTDGCVSQACITTGNNSTAPHTKAQNDGATKQTVIRQATGISLFSQYDNTPMTP